MSRNFIGAIVIPVVGGYLSGWNNERAVMTWYREIKRPWYNPPDFVFPVVWTGLYAGIGYASYLVAAAGIAYQPLQSIGLLAYITQPALGLPLYALQLVPNYLWSPLFFWWREIGWSFIDSVALVGLVIPTTVSFWKSNRTAGLIMSAYLAWISIATVINFEVWRMNRRGSFKKINGRWRFFNE